MQGVNDGHRTTTMPKQSERAVAGAIHEHWGLFLVEGIILVILGLAAIACR